MPVPVMYSESLEERLAKAIVYFMSKFSEDVQKEMLELAYSIDSSEAKLIKEFLGREVRSSLPETYQDVNRYCKLLEKTGDESWLFKAVIETMNSGSFVDAEKILSKYYPFVLTDERKILQIAYKLLTKFKS